MGDVLSLEAACHPAVLGRDRETRVHALLRVNRPERVRADRARAFVVVVDATVGMTGAPEAIANEWVRHLVRNLPVTDSLTVIQSHPDLFDATSGGPLPLTLGDAREAEQRWRRIATLLARAPARRRAATAGDHAAFAALIQRGALVRTVVDGRAGIAPAVDVHVVLLSNGLGLDRTTPWPPPPSPVPDVAWTVVGVGAFVDDDILGQLAVAYRAARVDVRDRASARASVASVLARADGRAPLDVRVELSPRDGVTVAGVLGGARVSVIDGGLAVDVPDIRGPGADLVVELTVRAPQESQRVALLDVRARTGGDATATAEISGCVTARPTLNDADAATRVAIARAEDALFDAVRVVDADPTSARALVDAGRAELARIRPTAALTIEHAGARAALDAVRIPLPIPAHAVVSRPSTTTTTAAAARPPVVTLGSREYVQVPATRRASTDEIDPLVEEQVHVDRDDLARPHSDRVRDAPFVAPPNEHVLRIEMGDRVARFGFRHDEIVVGRAPPSDIVITHCSIGRRHMKIEVVDGCVIVTDLMSTNGTIVDGQRIRGPTVVPLGVPLAIGRVRVVVERLASARRASRSRPS